MQSINRVRGVKDVVVVGQCLLELLITGKPRCYVHRNVEEKLPVVGRVSAGVAEVHLLHRVRARDGARERDGGFADRRGDGGNRGIGRKLKARRSSRNRLWSDLELPSEKTGKTKNVELLGEKFDKWMVMRMELVSGGEYPDGSLKFGNVHEASCTVRAEHREYILHPLFIVDEVGAIVVPDEEAPLGRERCGS